MGRARAAAALSGRTRRRPVETLLIALVVMAALFALARFVLVPRLSTESAATGPVAAADGAPTLGDCPGSPNCAGSEASDPARRTERLRIGTGGADALDAVERWLEGEPDARVERRDGDYLHATFTSRLMGYTDDVEFLAMPDGAVAIRSASRLGRSDLGANARRVERIRTALGG